MKELNFKTMAITLLLLSAFGLKAQSGACSGGATIGADAYINFNFVSSGDMDILSAGKLTVAGSGVLDLYGALTNGATVTIESGGVLNVYGDMINNADIEVKSGGRLNFYGNDWTNAGSARVFGTGDVFFTSSRPTIGADWITAAPCLSSYSAGSFTQNLDGGGNTVDMDIKLHVNNANNIQLINTNASIAGTVSFDVNDGHIVIGDQDLLFTSTGGFTGHNEQRYVVTDGDGHMVKEGLASAALFTFPVGRAEADYTPATIQNDAVAADVFHVNVKNYTESASDEFDPDRGMDRTWNIYSDNGSGASLLLQHNSVTNATGDYFNQGGDAMAFVTQYLGAVYDPSTMQVQGDWQTGSTAGLTDAAGTIAGSRTHIRSYGATATSDTADAAYFSKSSNLLEPLPIVLLNFEVKKLNEQSARLTWITASETNSDYFMVMKQFESGFKLIGKVKAAGHSEHRREYVFIDHMPQLGMNYYRLQMVDIDGSSKTSEIKYVNFEAAEDFETSVWPNPSSGIVYIQSSSLLGEIKLLDATGKLVFQMSPDAAKLAMSFDIADLAPGVYTVYVQGAAFKIIKN